MFCSQEVNHKSVMKNNADENNHESVIKYLTDEIKVLKSSNRWSYWYRKEKSLLKQIDKLEKEIAALEIKLDDLTYAKSVVDKKLLKR